MLDTRYRVEIPGGIKLEAQVVGPIPRFFAFLIDLTIRGLFFFVLMLATIPLGAVGGFGLGGGVFMIAMFLIEWFYPVLFEIFWRGQTPGKRVLVAWDSSREAARAVNDSLPLLARADAVHVVSINPRGHKPGELDRLPGADICLQLARHGVKAEAQHLVATDIEVGDLLLSRAADMGADLLVMGAYGHSRWREIVLGGATRQILGEMTVPVIMSH